MYLIKRDSDLWAYLPDDIKGLVTDGELLVQHAKDDPHKVSDFSYLVFPFSKAYEGFLKKLFLDVDLIREDEYYGDDIRIGRILNPKFVHEHENVFNKIQVVPKRGKISIAEKLWSVWKRGRNQVFHYFPHNFRRLSFDEALELVQEIIAAMTDATAK